MSRVLRIHHFPVAWVAVVLLAMLVCCATATTENRHVVLLNSHDAAPHKEVLAGFRQYLSGKGSTLTFEEHTLQGQTTPIAPLLAQLKQNGTSLIFTVGALATEAVLAEAGEVPVIAALAASADTLHKTPNATGVVTDFPLETQFQWMQKLLTDSQTVGVLFNPRKNQQKVTAEMKIAQVHGMELIARPVETPRTLPEELHELAKKSKALWSITDPTVFSPETAELILLFSFRNRVPLIGLSTAWVKAGALYALDRDYRDLGAQCGEMAAKVLAGERAKNLPPETPRAVIYTVNLKTARHMKLTVDKALIEGARQVFD